MKSAVITLSYHDTLLFSVMGMARLMAVGLLCLTASVTAQTSSDTGKPLVLRLDPSKTNQTIVGFGASDAWRLQMVGKYWPEEKRNRIADLLFSANISADGKPQGIGLSLWRFYLGSGSMEQGRVSGIADEWRRAECFQSPDGTYDWSKQQGQQWFLRAARTRGVSNFLAFSIAAPAHMALNGKAHGTGTNTLNIQPDKVDDYARFLADVMEHFERELKLPFQYLSPINEPQWDWASSNNQEGTALSNAECHGLVRLTAQELQRRKLSTRIVFGEAGEIRYLYSRHNRPDRSDQIRAFFSRDSQYPMGALPNVANVISGHSYGTTWPVEEMIATRLALRQALDQLSPTTEYWQSEFCILEQTRDIGGGRRRDLGMDTALYVARVIHADMTLANAASWQWWTAVTRCDYKDGLVYIDDGKSPGRNSPPAEYAKHDGEIRESKLLWAMGNYSRFVRPGMVRIEAEFQNRNLTPLEEARDLMVSAYLDPSTGKRVVVFVNYARESRQVVLPSAKTSTVDAYVTSENRDLQRQTVAANLLEIPSRAVVTAVLN